MILLLLLDVLAWTIIVLWFAVDVGWNPADVPVLGPFLERTWAAIKTPIHSALRKFTTHR